MARSRTSALPLFHRLVYAGVDVSALSAPRTLYRGRDGERLHGSSSCWHRRSSWRAPSLVPTTVDPTTVPASKACPGCFDAAFQGVEGWTSGLFALAESISGADASFLRTALSARSKKNTAELAAQQLRQLDAVRSRLANHLSGDALHEREQLERRIEDRARAVRAGLLSSGARDALCRQLAATGATRRPDGRPDVRAAVVARLSRSTWDAEGFLKEALTRWTRVVGTDGDLAAAADAFRTHVRAAASLEGFHQLEFEPHRAPRPGESAKDWNHAAWSHRVEEDLTEALATWEERYRRSVAATSPFLVTFLVPQNLYTDPASEQLFHTLVELHLVHRHGWRVTLLVPDGLRPALSVLGTSSLRSVDAVAADGVSVETAHTAASLFDPGSPAFSTLEAALDAARALL